MGDWGKTVGIACALALGGCGDDGGSDGNTDTDPVTSATQPTGVDSCDTECSDTTGGSSTTQTPPTTSTSVTTATDTTDPSETSSGSTTGEPAVGPLRLYVSGGGAVTVWEIDDATGNLTAIETVDLMTGIGPLAIDPGNNYLYAARGDQQAVTAFSIDQTDGSLTEIGGVGVGHRPVYLATDQTGGHLLTADFGADLMEIYPVAADGSVGDTPTESRNTSARPHLIFTDETNSFIFVPCRDSGVIEQYIFDATTGTVTPNTPPNVAAPNGTGPRHLAIAPDGTQAYLAGEFNSTLNVFDYDAAAGTMTFVEALTTLPEGFNENNTTADVHVTPDGANVYISNRGHDSLAMFEVGAAGLTSLGQAPTEETPREFGLSPRGRYVYAAGQATGMLASYTVEADGTLTAGPLYAVGDNPLWVLSIELPAP